MSEEADHYEMSVSMQAYPEMLPTKCTLDD